jgi:ribosomal protein S18 acetylase RimI-like enzyme
VWITDLPLDRADDAVALWHECGLTRPWNDPHADLTRAVIGPSSTVLAAVDTDVLAGTAMVGHDGHRGWVYYLAVRPDRRRAGLGRVLMDASERWLAEREVPKVQLMVRRTNASVVAFYTSLGYDEVEVRVFGKFLRDG